MKTKIKLITSTLCLCFCAVVAIYANRGESVIPKAEINAYFSEADTNGDGVLTNEEFKNFVVQMNEIRENDGRIKNAPAPVFARTFTGDPTKSATHGPLDNPEVFDNAGGVSSGCGGCGGCGKSNSKQSQEAAGCGGCGGCSK